MNRQVTATHISLLVHGLLLWGAVVLNQYAQPIRPPVVLDFSILASGGSAEESRPAATPEVKPPPSVEKKVTPKKPVVNKKPQPQTIPKKTLPPVAEKTPPVETVPVAANTDASPAQNTASAEAAAQSSAAAQTPGSGQAGGGGGGIFSVGQLDAPLTALAKMPPAYPPSAKRQNVEGWIKVKFVIDEHGQVGHVSVLAAEPQGVFEQSVLRCISNWRFKPGTVNGLAVKALVEQTITFKLEG